jgi:hypothetical protein
MLIAQQRGMAKGGPAKFSRERKYFRQIRGLLQIDIELHAHDMGISYVLY